MNKNEKIRFAKQQLSEKWKCNADHFDSDNNIYIETQDLFFRMATFGNNAVIWADKKIIDWCSEKFSSSPARWIMESDNFYLINEKLRSFGKKLGDEHIGYLHLLPENTIEMPVGFTYKSFDRNTVKELHTHKEFNQALSFTDNDMLAFAAYNIDVPICVSACDAYSEDMWEIGIDTLPKYRNCGLAAYLVKELALEIEKHGKVAYYNTWSANIASTRVALKSGFRPVWVHYPCYDL